MLCSSNLISASILLASIQAALAFAHPSTAAYASLTCKTGETHPTLPQLSADQVRKRVQSGRVYVHDDFLTEAQLKLLQRDMHQLDQEGKFIVNGLSDVRKGLKGEALEESATSQANQDFDVRYDRSVCPIPWWQDSLASFDEEVQTTGGDGQCITSEYDSSKDKTTLRSIQVKLQRLRRDLAEILDRPTMLDSSLGHECYYSKSNPGSSLARHMDERHEESKGPRGWLLPSRRSLSWLIYLSETLDEKNGISGQNWDAEKNGGLLRTFPQRHYRPRSDVGWGNTVHCGSHDGNLQVGWLLVAQSHHDSSSVNETTGGAIAHPIFLDCWYQHLNPHTGEIEPHNVLYIVRKLAITTTTSDGMDSDKEQIEYITVPWMPDAVGGNVMEFLQHRATLESSPEHSSERLFLNLKYAFQFKLLEDREAWDRGDDPAGSEVEDILPLRGRLVVFDSVTLPHEVTSVINGSRSALAGWFHEETQPLGG